MPEMPVDVVIPVYGNHVSALACLDAVLAAREHCFHHILVVDDASPDEETGPALRRRLDGESGCRYIEHEHNLGFAAAVNTGLAASDRDVVILNSDVVVPQRWLDRLAAAATSADDVGTVTPFTNDGSICSYPVFCARSDLPEGLDLATLDGLFERVNGAQRVELPTGVGFCMYITRRCVDAVGLFDAETFAEGYGEENDFCLRASAEGFRHLLCGDLFVYHEGGGSFGSSKQSLMKRADTLIVERHPGYGALVQTFIDSDPPAPLRHAVDGARRELPGQYPQLLDEAVRREALVVADRLALREVREEERAQLDGYRAKCTELEGHLETARASFGEADAELLRQRAAYAALEEQLAEARGSAERIEGEFRRLEERQRELLAERDQLEERCQRLSFELSEALEQRDERQEQLDLLQKLLDEARAEFAVADTELGRVRETAAALRAELEQLNQMLLVRLQRRMTGRADRG